MGMDFVFRRLLRDRLRFLLGIQGHCSFEHLREGSSFPFRLYSSFHTRFRTKTPPKTLVRKMGLTAPSAVFVARRVRVKSWMSFAADFDPARVGRGRRS